MGRFIGGVLLANIAFFALGIGLLFVGQVGRDLLATAGLLMPLGDDTAGAGVWLFALVAVIVDALAAGYLAARIVRRWPLIGGLLSPVLAVLLYVYLGDVTVERENEPALVPIVVFGLPLIGLLGALLKVRKQPLQTFSNAS